MNVLRQTGNDKLAQELTGTNCLENNEGISNFPGEDFVQFT